MESVHHEGLRDWLRLGMCPGVGPTTALALLKAFGPPNQIWQQSASALRGVVGERVANALLVEPAGLAAQWEATVSWLEKGAGRHRIITLDDALYPGSLLDLSAPPLVLYAHAAPEVWSRLGESWTLPRSLAVVGSRNPTPQGAQNARAFARALVDAGVCIVSGLALGVDGAAHEGALDSTAQAPTTIAVVGTGLDRVYPARHRDLAHRIAERGILLSEFALGTPPLAAHFPQRNRIIAALGAGTLVVEAALQSGSLITARLSGDLGREVLAVPGSIHSPLSRGCHQLIRQGAKLVESAQDILEEFPRWEDIPPTAATAPVAPPSAIPSDNLGQDCAVLAALGFEPSTVDAVLARTGWDIAAVQARLLELELSGRVQRLPGGLFQRCAMA